MRIAKYRRYLFVSFVNMLIVGFGSSVEAQSMSRSDEPITLPFTLVDNRVFLQASMNGQGPFALLLDTGAGDGSSVSMETYDRLHLPKEGQDVITGAGSASAKVIKTHVESLRLGSVDLGRQPMLALPLKTLKDTIGFSAFDGILGNALFHRYVVTLDFTQRRLVLENAVSYRPPANAVIVPFSIYGGFVPIYNGVVNGIAGKFLLDLGDRSSLTLYSRFWRSHRLDAGRTSVVAMTGIGIGGPVRGIVTRVDELMIGTDRVTKPLTRLLLEKQSAIDDRLVAGSVGTGILKNFLVTFDYAHHRMVLMPNGGGTSVAAYDRVGWWLGRRGDQLEVLDITRGGPAEKADIRKNDLILSINGTAASAIDLPTFRDQSALPASRTLDVILERVGQRSSRRIALRDLVPLNVTRADSD